MPSLSSSSYQRLLTSTCATPRPSPRARAARRPSETEDFSKRARSPPRGLGLPHPFIDAFRARPTPPRRAFRRPHSQRAQLCVREPRGGDSSAPHKPRTTTERGSRSSSFPPLRRVTGRSRAPDRPPPTGVVHARNGFALGSTANPHPTRERRSPEDRVIAAAVNAAKCPAETRAHQIRRPPARQLATATAHGPRNSINRRKPGRQPREVRPRRFGVAPTAGRVVEQSRPRASDSTNARCTPARPGAAKDRLAPSRCVLEMNWPSRRRRRDDDRRGTARVSCRRRPSRPRPGGGGDGGEYARATGGLGGDARGSKRVARVSNWSAHASATGKRGRPGRGVSVGRARFRQRPTRPRTFHDGVAEVWRAARRGTDEGESGVGEAELGVGGPGERAALTPTHARPRRWRCVGAHYAKFADSAWACSAR